MCGNYDGDNVTDLITSLNQDVSLMAPELQGQLIAQSYMVHNK